MLVHVETITSKLNWAILPICCVMIGCCYLDRSNVAYMQLQLRRPPPAGMDFSPSLYGNASGLFFLGYSICQIPSNMILARVGAPLWLAVIVTLWGLCATLLAAVRGPAGFLVLRVLLGVFEAGTFPGIWYHMTLFYPSTHLTIPLSVTKSAIMAAQLLSAPVAAGLISLDGALGLRGWQWIAVAEGGVTAAVGMFLKLLLPKTPAHVASLSAEEVAWVNSHVSKPPTSTDLLSGMRYAATSRALWMLTAAYSAKSFAAYSLIFWTPLVISDLLARAGGPSVADAGTAHDRAAVALTAVPYAFAAAASYLLGWSSHAWNERRAHTYVPFAVGAAVLLAAPLLQGPGTAVLAFAALCVAMCACNATGPLTACVVGCLPREAQAGGLAMWNAVACVSGYFGPATFGWLKGATDSNAPGMVVMGGVLVAGAMLMWCFDEAAAIALAERSAAPLPAGPGPGPIEDTPLLQHKSPLEAQAGALAHHSHAVSPTTSAALAAGGPVGDDWGGAPGVGAVAEVDLEATKGEEPLDVS